MKLDELKNVLKEDEEVRMEKIYERIIEAAKSNYERVKFSLSHNYDNTDHWKLNEKQMKRLVADGYTVDWVDEDITVYGW